MIKTKLFYPITYYKTAKDNPNFVLEYFKKYESASIFYSSLDNEINYFLSSLGTYDHVIDIKLTAAVSNENESLYALVIYNE